MEVILLTDVDKVGLRGDVVNVAPGFARNFLLPRKLAEAATPARLGELEKIEARRARQEARSAEDARAVADRLEQTELRFDAKAGPTGSLFGSVTATDISDAIWNTLKIRVDRRKVELPEPIKRIGRHSVAIEVFQGVRAEVRTLVVPEGGELPPDEELAAMAAAEAAEPQGAADALAATAAQDAQIDAEEITPESPAGDVAEGEFDRAPSAALDAEHPANAE